MPKYDAKGNLKSVNARTSTKYDGKAFERFLDHCWKGGSIPQFCRQEKISRTCFDSWIEKYDPKNEVKPKAKVWAEGWWLQEAQDHLTTISSKNYSVKFDTNLYKFVVGGRFGHTADKDAHERLDKIEQQMQKSAMSQMQNSAIAEEAECEPEEIKQD